ncbi:MAG: hypothetical protein EOM19_00810 [Candidatus Moranbacteria bacterium]|nr:hypothetical protein [Candidatus Moranbacteria bacterium]
MFSLVKGIIWMVGFIVVGTFVLNYFGYKVNRDYFNESKEKCFQKLNECKEQYIRQGTENAQCNFNCVDPKLIIEKKI